MTKKDIKNMRTQSLIEHLIITTQVKNPNKETRKTAEDICNELYERKIIYSSGRLFEIWKQ